MNTVRSKEDSMGATDVPADRLWGTQTQCSLEYFCIPTKRMPTSLIHALILTKRAAAEVSENLGLLSEEKMNAIQQVTDGVLAGQHGDELPLAIQRTGSDAQSSINMGEVPTNQASELLGDVYGIERKVHPNDDVNKSQSSSNVFLMAIRATALLALCKQLVPRLRTLTQTLSEKFHMFADVVKIGHTHLQDATPSMLGQKTSDWVAMLERNFRHIEYNLPRVAELVLGGTAVGAGLNTRPEYVRHVVNELTAVTCTLLITTSNKFEVLTACNALVQAHGTLKGLVASLMKIANDVRWLASGPCCEIDEISIPKNGPGDLIIPGRVSPTQYEALIILCCQMAGNDVVTNVGGASGNSELNIFRPMVTHNFLQPVCLLADGIESFSRRCVVGIEPNRKRINQLPNESLILMIAPNTHIGYDKAVEITKKAHKEELTLKAVVLALGYPSEAEFDRWT